MFRKIIRWLKKPFRKISTDDINSHEAARLSLLEEKVGFNFGRTELYRKALTHRSFLEINPDLEKSNERLEFLGDAVLGLVAAETLFLKYPSKNEGYLTKYRSQLVDKESLYKSAQRLNLIDFVLYDKRYVKGSEEGKKTIVADCLEALIGAIYLDVGLHSATEFVHKWIIDPNLKSGDLRVDKNFKGQLLEYTHSQKLESPKYKVVSENGPDHDKNFQIEVLIGDQSFGLGEGKNKKSAEQEAARIALEKINS
ncbi:MAG: ribonuclease III [Melioribacteraceae bacterium]|nr:ribonuclease III [Melioribacteraceae bacterium]